MGDFRISIIVTSYNQKQYLIEAIESVINQTVRPYEIIVADDHSTDGSVEVIQEYIARYPGWIRGIFQEENVGIPKNRNAALRQVTGDYVSILDGDDRFLPNKTEQEIQALQRCPEAQAVYANLYFIDATGSRIRIRDKDPQPRGNIFKEVFAGQFGMLRSMLIEYSVLDNIDLMDPDFWHYDGFDLTVRLAARCYIAYIPDPMCEIRLHRGGAAGWRKVADELSDLRGIYGKNKHLLANLSASDKKEVERTWSRRFSRLRIRVARERGDHIMANLMFLLALGKGQLTLRDLRGMLAPAVPKPIRRTIKLLWRRT